MMTDRERLDRLEILLGDMRQSLNMAGAAIVSVLTDTLDQMVDEQFLPAKTRTEIWGRIRKGMPVVRMGAKELADGMDRAMPQYRTVQERAEFVEREKQFEQRVRKAILTLDPNPRKKD